MRLMIRVAVVVIALSLTQQFVAAQAPFGAFRANPLVLLRQESVQKELKLTDDQKKKIADVSKEIREKMQNGGAGADRRALMQEGRTKVEAILTAEQKAAIEKYNKEHPRGQGRGQRPPRTDA